MIRRLVSRVVSIGLVVTFLAAGLIASLFANPTMSASAQSACNDAGAQIVLGWANGSLPQEYYLLAPDASQGWQGDIAGFYGTPIYVPQGWGYQMLSDGTGIYLAPYNGGAALAMDFAVPVSGNVSSDGAAAWVAEWLLGGAGMPACDVSGTLQGSLPTQISVYAEQAGGFTALAYVFVMPDPNSGQAIVSYYALVGPTNQIGDLTVGVLIPLLNMYVRPAQP